MKTKNLLTIIFLLLLTSCNVLRRTPDPRTHDEGVVINGIRWATRNVDMPGTFAPTPENPGMFFQWNKKKGWNSMDRYVEGWDNSIPKGTKWYAENDPCPQGWRVPTYEELLSLGDIESEWTTQNGISGRLFGTAPHQIFLPTADNRVPTFRIGGASKVGRYWSSTQHDDSTRARVISFVAPNLLDLELLGGADGRNRKFSIRCVAK